VTLEPRPQALELECVATEYDQAQIQLWVCAPDLIHRHQGVER
jgi:hypothetical protein